MLKWVIGLLVVVAAALVWFLGFGGAGLSPSKDNKYLDRVPADTVFFLGASTSREISEFMAAYPAFAILPSQKAGIDSMMKELGGSDEPPALFLNSLIEQFQEGSDGTLGSVTAMTGVALEGDAAIYMHGVVPVLSADFDDPQKFLGILDKAAADSTLNFEQKSVGSLSVRALRLAPEGADMQVWLAIASRDSSLTVSFISDSDSESILLERFGESLPGNSLKTSGKLDDLKAKYGYSDVMTTFIDIEGLVKAFVEPGSNGLSRDLQRYLPADAQQELFAEIPPACRTEFAQLAAQAPRIVSGYTAHAINGDVLGSEATMVLELLNTDLTAALTSMRGHVPSYVTQAGEPVISLGLGIDMDTLVPALTKLWLQFTQATYGCEVLVELQDEVRDANPAMLQAFLGSFDGIKGLGFALYDLALGDDWIPENISAIVSVAVEDPVTLAAMVSLIPDPSLSNLRIPKDGSSAPIEHPMMPPSIKPLVSIQGQHLAIYMGAEGEQQAMSLKDEALEANGVYALGLNYRGAGALFERERKNLQLEDEQCAQLAEFSSMFARYSLDMVGILDVSEAGFFLGSSSNLDRPQSNQANVGGRYDAYYFEQCQPKLDGEEFFNADGTGSAYSNDESGQCKVWETQYTWHQSGSAIHFKTTKDRYRDSCADEWQDSENLEDSSCTILSSTEGGFTCLYIYQPGEPGTLIEYRQ
jgi:hypothetical protein